MVAQVLLLLLAVRLPCSLATDASETSCARAAVGNQQRIGRIDDDEILDADGGDQRPSRSGCSSPVRVLEHGVAMTAVAVRIVRRRSPTATTRSRRRSSRHRSAAPPPCPSAPSRRSRPRCSATLAKASPVEPQKAQVALGAASSALVAASRMAGAGAPAHPEKFARRRRRCRCSRSSCPSARYSCAVAASGFSVKASTAKAPSKPRERAPGGYSRSRYVELSALMPNSTSLPWAAARRGAANGIDEAAPRRE